MSHLHPSHLGTSHPIVSFPGIVPLALPLRVPQPRSCSHCLPRSTFSLSILLRTSFRFARDVGSIWSEVPSHGSKPAELQVCTAHRVAPTAHRQPRQWSGCYAAKLVSRHEVPSFIARRCYISLKTIASGTGRDNRHRLGQSSE